MKANVRFEVLLVALAVTLMAVSCGSGRERASPELIATLTVCPYGVQDRVLSTYTPECVRDLFGGEIRLLSPGSDYFPASFRIITPAEPSQLQAVYGSKSGDEAELLRLNVDPPDVLPLLPIVDRETVGDLEVGISRTHDDRAQFYWSENGWNYTLEAPIGSDADRDYVLDLIMNAE